MNRCCPSPIPRDALLDQLATAVLVLDERLRVRDLNGAAEALLALSANQVRGMALAEVVPAARRHLPALERALASGRVLREREMRLERPGGGELALDCTVTPVLGSAGGAALVLELVDLGRGHRLSRDERLRAEHEAARALVRGLAHELRNPLGGLRGAAQLLERELAEPRLREYTRVIVGEADRMQGLLDRMLGPRQPPRMQVFSCHELTERVLALAAAEAGPGVALERDYDPSLPALHGDRDLLNQALLNVVRNAVQAVGERGRVVLRTRIEAPFTLAGRQHRQAVRIDVIDDGPGIPPGLTEQVFYPMVTGRSDGTGLGLSIAQGLVRRHGGIIECASEPGRTTFSLLLPLPEEGAQ